jgi:hypothetical protein
MVVMHLIRGRIGGKGRKGLMLPLAEPVFPPSLFGGGLQR